VVSMAVLQLPNLSELRADCFGDDRLYGAFRSIGSIAWTGGRDIDHPGHRGSRGPRDARRALSRQGVMGGRGRCDSGSFSLVQFSDANERGSRSYARDVDLAHPCNRE
jgi:hypothetical protein